MPHVQFPRPGSGRAAVAVPAPGTGPGSWAGASSAALDPVVRVTAGGWEAWICCHPLDAPGEDDRMTTAYATSADGVSWRRHGVVLVGRAGLWDSRGARVTSVLSNGQFAYDGRATKEENFSERTGLGRRAGEVLEAFNAAPIASVRYMDVVELPGGGFRTWYEAPLPDGSHELRTELVDANLRNQG